MLIHFHNLALLFLALQDLDIISCFFPASFNYEKKVLCRAIRKQARARSGNGPSRSAGSIWECHQTVICCVDILITSGMLQPWRSRLPCLPRHFKTTDRRVGIMQNIESGCMMERQTERGEREGNGAKHALFSRHWHT